MVTPRLVYALGMQSVKGESGGKQPLCFIWETLELLKKLIGEIKERLSQKWGGWSPRVGVASWWAWPPACDFLGWCDLVSGSGLAGGCGFFVAVVLCMGLASWVEVALLKAVIKDGGRVAESLEGNEILSLRYERSCTFLDPFTT